MTGAPAEIAAAGCAFPAFEAGAGATVLLLHGALGDWRTFAPHARRLAARGFRAISVTQRWFGTGGWPADGPPFGVATHAADLAAMLDVVGPAHVVAWSYAAHPAMLGVASRPGRALSLSLYEPGCSVGLSGSALAEWTSDARAWFGPIRSAPDLTWAARSLMDGSMQVEDALGRLPPDRAAIVLENAPTLARLFAQTPPPSEPPSAAAPSRVARGADTRAMFRLGAEGAAAALGCAPPEVVPGAGHMWPETDMAGFCDWVERGCGRAP